MKQFKETFTIFDYAAEDGRSFLDHYRESIKWLNKKAKNTLSVIEAQKYYNNPLNRMGFISNTNPFVMVHLFNQGIFPKGVCMPDRLSIKSLTYQQKRENIPFNKTKLQFTNIDFGLGLIDREPYAYNGLLARILFEELKSMKIKIEEDKVNVVPLDVLRLDENTDSEYGLVFRLKDNIKAITNLRSIKHIDEDLRKNWDRNTKYKDFGGLFRIVYEGAFIGRDERLQFTNHLSAPNGRIPKSKNPLIKGLYHPFDGFGAIIILSKNPVFSKEIRKQMTERAKNLMDFDIERVKKWYGRFEERMKKGIDEAEKYISSLP